jgi:hypothetical protein
MDRLTATYRHLVVAFSVFEIKGVQMIRSVEIERFSVTSAKPFDEVVAGLKEAIGHPNMAEFWQSTHWQRLLPN